MSRKVHRVPVSLDAGEIKDLPQEDIRMILRGADELISTGGSCFAGTGSDRICRPSSDIVIRWTKAAVHRFFFNIAVGILFSHIEVLH